ncbi:Bactoprenol glucosyl transferase [Marinilactibacillus psychrotolerans 42ea]|uniref:Bactoprenol glucosyl transferase n=1 Tax=Marinilactibacillus psychrotolerans 42ea TaxID=1255609 RepID=A0A1R4I9N0_9LACT|nr:glycosyltransferase family 2 protein [Marinilactibacillus psychrotolerans]SJN16520.1 Bactoprenol glucosyl transferase [Marinilactibacillus psychrotolerans 42ea]
MLSIVIPCYNEEDMISLFYNEVEKVNFPLEKEFLFIDDGSSDRTLEELKKLAEKNQNVNYISFSRNFGKEAALFAGLKESKGDYVVVMDVDLQDPPELLVEMYESIINEDYDCVGTRRATRHGEPPIRTIFAKSFYKIMSKISDTEIVDGARDYRMMSRQMVDSILQVNEYNRFSKGIFSWVGYKTKYLEYENKERAAGTTTWSFWGLLKYSIEGIIAFSDAPLSIASFIGTFTFILSLIMALMITIRTVIFDNPTQGWTSLMVIILGLGGLQLLCLGILGKYVSKTFMETKRRPLYFIKEKNDKKQ